MSLSSAINSFLNSFVLVSFNPRLPAISAVLCHSPSLNSNRLVPSYSLTYIFQIYYFLQKRAKKAEDPAFLGSYHLFKLAEFGLIQFVLMQLSILCCIDNSYIFHSLFFVSHIFSTNPVPLLYCHYCV